MSLNIQSVDDDQSPLLSSYNPEESFRDTSRRLRQPVTYQSVSTGNGSQDSRTSAVTSRYKYYSRLDPHSESTLTMPDHVVPGMFLISEISQTQGTQASWVTIFSLWNTMMGTSLLSMPWAINQAGFTCGIALLLAMGALMLYTSYRVLHSVRGIKTDSGVVEFSDVCRSYLGRWAEVVAFLSSLLTLLGGMIVYWILISNFLYNIVTFIYHQAKGDDPLSSGSTDPICPSRSPHGNGSNSAPNDTYMSYIPYLSFFSDNVSDVASSLQADGSPHDATFDRYWDEQKTVPFILIVIIFPLINFKSPTFFTKFNALGTISVTYLVCFAMKNAISWGIHLDFNTKTSPFYVFEYKNSFPALTGVSALAYFVQNCVLSITRAQKHTQHIVRDLIIAYALVAFTYIYMGVIVYISFGLDKNCLEDNFLNNLKDTNVMAFVARIGLFFQMICVFPLLIFIFRLQFMNSLFGTIWPGLTRVVILNIVIIGVCLIFAVFLPHIGKIIGFVGAFCGFSYAIALPCAVYMKIRYNAGTLTAPVVIIHSILIVLGLANFIAQFLLLG